ncbi:MAG: T9SS type A sorting domain-containing protein [Saprospiraceae bacterium]|nr:T9SS type A sorting domain-containing protein [Saprospiraceae bacterium]
MLRFIRYSKLLVLILLVSGIRLTVSGQTSDDVSLYLVDKGWAGDTNLIELRVTGFKNISAFQFSFRDENRLGQLVGVDQIRLPNLGPSNFNFQSGFNALTVSWDFAVLGATLPDGEVLFRIKWLSDSTKLHCYEISNAPILIEFLDENAQSLNVTTFKSCQIVQFIPTYLNVFRDQNLNCVYDNQEFIISDYTIVDSFNGRSRVLKNPQLLGFSKADYGFHYFSVTPASPLWNSCNRTQVLYIDSSTQIISIQFGLQPLADCPLLNVDLSSPVVRRCVDYPYQINYQNTGTLPESNAVIRITLDSFMIYKGANIPASLVQWPFVEFNLGLLDVFQSGSFQIMVELDCNRTIVGQTHCIKAEILPKIDCIQSQNWSKANLEVAAACADGKVKFRILNSGEQNMSEPSQYWIVEDDIMPGLKKNVLLNKDAFLDLEYPANGKTYRLIVDQVAFHPRQSKPSVVIEGCGRNQQGDFSRGYVLQFPEDEEDLHIAIDCQESRGSFDPNDKMAWPRGYGLEQFVEPNRQIEYRIRFQNTGNDTAFQVTLLDSLDEWLDLTSFTPTGSSHPYKYSLIGQQLKVVFDKISLPYKAVDENGSQGYFSYSLKPLAAVPLKTKVFNTAAIIFDINAAVITNTTLHTISKDFIVVDTKSPAGPEKHLMNIFPNPNTGFFQITTEGLKQNGVLSIVNAYGKTCFRQTWQGPSFQFNLNQKLAPGLYFRKLENQKGVIEQDKLLVIPAE